MDHQIASQCLQRTRLVKQAELISKKKTGQGHWGTYVRKNAGGKVYLSHDDYQIIIEVA